MKKIYSYLLIGIIILGVAYFSGLLSIADLEFGWIPYGEFDDRFSPPTTQTFDTFTSKYWIVKAHAGTTHSLISFFDPSDSRNNDRNVKIGTASTGGAAVSTGGGVIIFNQPVYMQRFKVNYEINSVSLKGSVSVGGFTGYLERGTGTIELNPYVDDPTQVEVLIDGIKVGVAVVNKDTKISMGWYDEAGEREGATLRVYNPRYQPLFGCVVDNDETLSFEKFASGTSFSIKDLNPVAKKFCYNYHVMIRDFTKVGIEADEQNRILDKLTRGIIINVPESQVYYIYYIVKADKPQMLCGLTSAWNAQEQKCESILRAGVIEERTGITKQVIDVGANEVLYTHKFGVPDLAIGKDLSLQATPYSFNCCPSIDRDGWIEISQKPDCFVTNVNGVTVKNGATFSLAPYLSAKYEAGGYGVFKGTKKDSYYSCSIVNNDDWINYFKITLEPEALDISSSQRQVTFGLNKATSLQVSINNKATHFYKAGVRITTKTLLLDKFYESYYEFSLDKGVKNYDIPLKVDVLGDVTTTVLPYVEINGKKLYSSNAVNFNYRVELGAEQGASTDVEITKTSLSWWQKIINWIKNLFG